MQQTKRTTNIRPDHAIMTRIKLEDISKQADQYDRKLKTIGVNTDWFESQQKYEVKKNKKINDKNVRKELLLTNQEIKLRRYQRLLELYYNEAEMLEQELSDRGLAIIKER